MNFWLLGVSVSYSQSRLFFFPMFCPNVSSLSQLVDWITAKAVFGLRGCNVETDFDPDVAKNAWVIAKLHKFRRAPLSDVIKKEYSSNFIVAETLLQDDLIKDPELREQLEQIEVPSECIDFIEYLLTVDPDKRPSVSEALGHQYLQD
jgi:serine/threonine protein kinase